MLAIIPARAGSKGLPNKNILPLNGKPLIAYTIEAALGAKEITKIIISTDSEKIVELCQTYNIEVPFLRPDHLATDDALIIDTYLYTLERLNAEFGDNFDSLVSLLPTCPLRTSKDIDEAVRLFKQKDADSVVSYYEAPHPVQWYKYIDENGVLQSVVPDGDKLANRQEERKSYLPNGGIYVFKKDLLKQRKYYSEKSYPYLMPASRSIDIDTAYDFQLAEFTLTYNNG